MLAGVAGGLADYFDVDPTIVRIAFVALAFLGGLAVPLYLAGVALSPTRTPTCRSPRSCWPASGPTVPSDRRAGRPTDLTD